MFKASQTTQPTNSLAWLQSKFLTGIVITAPIALTVWLVWSLISFIDARIKPLIPEQWNPESYTPFALPGLGVIVAFIGLVAIGWIGGNLIGRSVLAFGERLLNRIPLVRNIYRGLKQIFETVAAGQSAAFKEVVLVNFPSPDLWAIGFITTEASGEIGEHLHAHVSVFVPTAPNPTSGFMIFTKRDKLIPLNMTSEDAAKIVLSGGMITPRQETLAASDQD